MIRVDFRDLLQGVQIREHCIGLVLELLGDGVKDSRRRRSHARIEPCVRDLDLVIVLNLLDNAG